HESLDVSAFPLRYPPGYDVYFFRRLWGRSSSPAMLLRLWSMIRWADVVHLNEVYSPQTIPTLLACRLLGTPVIWSTRGALQRWPGPRRRQAKWLWERVCNSLVAPDRCVLHTTSSIEAGASRDRIPSARVATIPNGVDVPDELPRRPAPDRRLRLLYLGRLDP